MAKKTDPTCKTKIVKRVDSRQLGPSEAQIVGAVAHDGEIHPAYLVAGHGRGRPAPSAEGPLFHLLKDQRMAIHVLDHGFEKWLTGLAKHVGLETNESNGGLRKAESGLLVSFAGLFNKFAANPVDHFWMPWE